MSAQDQPKLRFAAVGVGANVYGMHRPGLQQNFVEVVGVADIDAAASQRAAEEWGCPAFTDYSAMLAETKPDVVSVLTPHPFHAPQTIEALQAGCHVLVEKPMAVQVSEADAMIAAAQKSGKILAINFQQRLRPEIIAARKLIADGELGQIQNADMKMTWTRTAIYYRMSTWRGTWNGEGGGVLMNQAPHELDLLCLLLGMPSRVIGWARTTLHKISTEDTIQAVIEWPNGAIGAVHISTAESGQPQRFEIMGTKGRLEISHGALKFQRFDTELTEFIRDFEMPFAAPNIEEAPVAVGAGSGDHPAVYRDLYSAIVKGTPISADGPSSIRGLELANAINYSSYTNQPVAFPLDREQYAALLKDLRAKHA